MSALPPGQGSPDDPTSLDAIRSVDRRLAEAKDPREILLWTYVRGELIRQNDEIEQRRVARQRQIEEVRTGTIKAFLAFAVGTFLTTDGYWLPGLLCLGAALYSLAPDYIREFRIGRGERGETHDQE